MGDGHRLAEEILARPAAERPDAVFATSDLVAIGLIRELRVDGRLRIRKTSRSVGFDDFQVLAAHDHPADHRAPA